MSLRSSAFTVPAEVSGDERPTRRGSFRRAGQAGLGVAVTVALAASLLATPAAASAKRFLGGLNTVSRIASTVPVTGPAAGDQNPYGTAVVPSSTGNLVRGDVLVSDFNNVSNAQGTQAAMMSRRL